MEYMGYIVQYGGLALTALFALGVVVGLVFGLIRGWKRSLIRFILIAVCIVLAAIMASVSYNFVVDIDASSIAAGLDMQFDGTLEQFLVHFAVELAGDLADVITAVPNITTAILQIAMVFVNLILFVAYFALFRFVSWLLFALIKLIFLGKDRQAKKAAKEAKRSGYSSPKYKKGGLLGGVIGLVQGVAIVLAFIIPVSAIVGTAGALVEAMGQDEVNAIIADEQNELSEILGIIVALDDAYKGSAPGVVYGATGIDKWIYGPLTTVKIGDEQFDLQSLSVLAGGLFNIMTQFGKLELPENATAAQFSTYLDGMLDVADVAIPLLLDNGLIRVFVNEIGTAVSSGLIDIDKLLGGSTADSKGALTGVALVQVVDSQVEEEPDFGSIALQAVLGIIADLASSDNLAQALKDSLLEVVDTVRDLNDDGVVFTLYQMIEGDDSFDPFADLTTARGIGKALDEIVKLSLFKGFQATIFGMVEGMLEDMLTEMGVGTDLSALDLSKIKWEAAIETVIHVMGIMEQMDGDITAVAGSAVTQMIDTLAPNQASGLVAVFEGFLKGMIVEFVGDPSLDLTDVDLDILANSVQFGILFDMLGEAEMFDVLAKSPSSFSQNDLNTVDRLSAYLNQLNQGTAGFKTLVGGLVNTLLGGSMGTGGDVSDVIGMLTKTVKAYKMFVELSHKQSVLPENWQDLDPSELEDMFTPDMAKELLETVVDEAILNTIEEMLNDAGVGSGGVDLGVHEEVVQDIFDDLVSEIANNPELIPDDIEEQLAQYERLADLLGLDKGALAGLLP